MNTTISTYEQQAIDFLAQTGTVINCEFLRNGKHFDDDKETRDIYSVTITKGQRKYTFNFGQSINASGAYIVAPMLKNKMIAANIPHYFQSLKDAQKFRYELAQNVIGKNVNFSKPTAYDILCCLTKYDPGTFENFCSEFGYDEDSRKAEKIYKAVKDEYQNVCALFSDSEIELLSEIQ